MTPLAYAPAIALLLGAASDAWGQHSGHSGHARHAQHDRHGQHAADAHAGHAAQATPCTPQHAASEHCTPAPGDTPVVSACTAAHAAMGHCTPAAAHAPATACTAEHAAMGHCTPAATPTPATTCPPEHAAMGHCTAAPTPAPVECPPEHAAMGHCTPTARPREPIPPVTDVDRAAAFPVLSHADMEHAPARYSRITLHRLEAWDGGHDRGTTWDASASTGGDIHRLWLRSGGERADGRTTASHLELQASRAVARWWVVVAGVRHDERPGASRTRAALGVQGIAPYLFEVSATAYLGEGGLSAGLEAEYDLRFSNRLVLQPSLELDVNARADQARGTGSGLSKAEAGLRLRYELTRRFAPYVGVVHERRFGGTARAHEAAGESARDTRVVAGVRIWF